DGPGIPESVLQKIIDLSTPTDPNPKKGGYGIKNVIKRLSLYYSDEYKLDVKSKVGEGTTIHIILLPSPVLTIREGPPDV
ncbi:MAG: sensor histidine kinase, partial [Acetanaerobacterium sp.]